MLRVIIKINWFKTIYLNLKLLPFSKAILFPFVVTGKVKFRTLTGKVIFKCPIEFGLVNIGFDVDNMPIALSAAQILIQGTLIINGNVIVNQGANLTVWRNGRLILGNDVMICSGVLLKTTNKITIGNHVMISSGCFIMDSSVHCIYNVVTNEVPPAFGEISIGNNVWLNMYTDIIKWGVPNGCVTARYTLINKPLDDSDAYCFLAGQPATIIKRNISLLHNFSTERIVDIYYRNEYNSSLVLSSELIENENLCKKILKANFF